MPKKRKVCTLLVLIDNSFLRIHHNNIRSAIAQILKSIDEANSLFRSTDFDNDGYPDNIGFLIKYFIVLQSERSPMNVFSNITKTLIDGMTFFI
ncbi:hypothetical protein NQ314_007403 [Rhamnusium bicolor]|uniref:Uncharacterized protein n=1 Tax=Rhamnusium bicolor TaxID=1586634 RepID=A0AAV8YMC0_9CUCU|nr:hypothetical protein NQ314_007403 [Rhamnusium bicolor]